MKTLHKTTNIYVRKSRNWESNWHKQSTSTKLGWVTDSRQKIKLNSTLKSLTLPTLSTLLQTNPSRSFRKIKCTTKPWYKFMKNTWNNVQGTMIKTTTPWMALLPKRKPTTFSATVNGKKFKRKILPSWVLLKESQLSLKFIAKTNFSNRKETNKKKPSIPKRTSPTHNIVCNSPPLYLWTTIILSLM